MSNFNPSLTTAGGKERLALRLCAWAGVVGPILFILVFTLDGAFRANYSAIQEPVSYLLLGTSGWIEIANFIAIGLAFIAFALGFLQETTAMFGTSWRRIGAALFLLTGLGFVIAGVFVPDPFGSNVHSFHNLLHSVGFVVVFFPLGLAGLLVGSQFTRTRGWRIVGWYTIVVGLSAIVVVIWSLVPSTSAPPALGGFFERVLVVINFAWVGITASRMLRMKNV